MKQYKKYSELTRSEIMRADDDRIKIGMSWLKFIGCEFIFKDDKYKGIMDRNPEISN